MSFIIGVMAFTYRAVRLENGQDIRFEANVRSGSSTNFWLDDLIRATRDAEGEG